MALYLQSVKRYVPQDGGNRDLPEDQQISLDIKLPKVRDMLEIQRLIREAGNSIAMPGIEINLEDPLQQVHLWDVMETIVVKHTANWKGVMLDDQTATEPGDVVRALGMENVTLVSEVTQEIMASGRGSVNEAKNSGSESGPSRSDSDSTVTPVLQPESSESVTAAVAS